MGMKGVHVINCTLASKLQILLNFVGRFASTKILERVMVHEQLQDIYNYIPKEYLPRDIGGNQPSCEEFRCRPLVIYFNIVALRMQLAFILKVKQKNNNLCHIYFNR